MTKRVRQAELARRLEVSRQAIGDLVARGILTVGDDGLLDEAASRAAIAANVHPAGKTAAANKPPRAAEQTPPPEQPQAAKPATIDYHAARTLREYTEAQRAALKLRQELGELAPLAEVARHMSMAVLDAREYLLAEPPRLAVLLDGLDRTGREALLAKTFAEFLRRLAEWKPEQ
jgi:hypothetical protein